MATLQEDMVLVDSSIADPVRSNPIRDGNGGQNSVQALLASEALSPQNGASSDEKGMATPSFGTDPVITEDRAAGYLADVVLEQIAERPGNGVSDAPTPNAHEEPDGIDFEERYHELEPKRSDAVASRSRKKKISQAARLDTQALYTAYRDRLERLDPNSDDTGNKAPRLVASVIDYIRVLEDRIDRLESADEGRKIRQVGETQERQTGETQIRQTEERPAEVKQNTQEETPQPRVKPEETELVLEMKFYNSEGEFEPDGMFMDNSEKPGAYTCATDPRHMLRVLYEWRDGHAQMPTEESSDGLPNPDEIDIIAFSTPSAPIAKFYEKRIGLTTDSSNVIRMMKPFRPLLRNVQLLRDQLSTLENRFGSVDSIPKGESGIPARAEGENRNPPPGGGLPSPDTMEAEAQPPAFDTHEALVHFRMLMSFIDRYLAPQIELMNNLKAAQEDMVAFENLWMLFDAGETIYCPSSEGGRPIGAHTTKCRYVPQCFRILGAQGGLPLFGSFIPKKPAGILDEYSIGENALFARLMMRGLGRASEDIPSKSKRKKDKFSMLFVVCFHIDFDGVKYDTAREIFAFKPYDGMMDIRSLEAYPIQYLRTTQASADTAGDGLIERGRKFIDTTSVSHLSYEGLTVGRSREEITSAVMVDFKLAFTEYSRSFPDAETVVPSFTSLVEDWPSFRRGEVIEFYECERGKLWCHGRKCTTDLYYGFHQNQARRLYPEIKLLLEEHDAGARATKEGLERFKDFMEDHDLLGLLPGVVPGFALRNRKWVQLDLDKLAKIEQRDDWHNLVLPKGHPEMVQAMVETHTRGVEDPRWAPGNHQERAEMDLVRGKGKGCVILLHGMPGVGKTSTAECVASYTQRPLYPITCGDIGYSPQEVEANMEKHFKLAHAWGCVLLLDEADVFLAKRNKQDVKRNGLVSVFLRILEYYSGILFLTTNRVGAIDDAFRSRLHLTLYYPKLTEKQTKKIWRNNMERMKVINQEREKRGQLPVDYDRARILKWVELNWDVLQWNGRQIRNAFQTAIALAEFMSKGRGPRDRQPSSSSPRRPVMDVSHFRQIAEASMQFNDYLLATHNANEDETALRDKIRPDPKTFTQSTRLRDLEEEESSPSPAESNPESGDGSTDGLTSEDSESEEDTKKSRKAKKPSKRTNKPAAREKKRTDKKEPERKRR